MSQEIVLSGVGTKYFREKLSKSLISKKPRAVGIAAAFVSIDGVQEMAKILHRCGNQKCRLIAGIDNAITHPEALYVAQELNWEVRLGKATKGIFHPKLIVAGKAFSHNGMVRNLCCVYVGSSNLTRGGLVSNVECGFVADAEDCLVSASNVFAQLWENASPATAVDLRNYAARFAERARCRALAELTGLGVNDSQPIKLEPASLRAKSPPSRPALGIDFAIAAWTGLQSFTGEYRFQIEFPKNAGKVVRRLIQNNAQDDGRVEVYCPDDEVTREMQYRFYQDNGMFRLNVPNEAPGVAWAREHKDGIAIVEQGPPGGAALRIRLLKPGVDANEIVGRSVVLGTWGKTSTRFYGWY